MLKALIKKQFLESFRGYFVNEKTNKARSKKSIAGFFVFFLFAMLMLIAIFYSVSSQLSGLLDSGMYELYYSLMGLIAMALGIFGSVFNTYSSLYLSKDNDLLLAMPIPPFTILLSRMALVLGLSLLYTGVVWFPALLFSWPKIHPSASVIIGGLLGYVAITLFVTAITCILGWIIALIASKVKKRSFAVVFLSLAFFALYYFVILRFTEYMEKLLLNAAEVDRAFSEKLGFLYLVGRLGNGDFIALLIFFAVSVLLCLACLYAMAKSFIKVSTKSDSVKKVSTKDLSYKSTNFKKALYKKELKRFTSSPSYMLNTSLGLVIIPIVTVVYLIKNKALQELLDEFFEEIPWLSSFMPLVVFFLITVFVAMNTMSTPSVSLEGNTFWIVQSLPIRIKDIVNAKIKMHVILSIWPAAISGTILCICMRVSLVNSVLVLAMIFAYTLWSATFGFRIGLYNPSTNWTTESVPLKSLGIVIVMLVNWLVTGALTALYLAVKKFLPTSIYLVICIALLLLVTFLIQKSIRKKESEIAYL